jgi:hypothetical protein
MGAPASDCLAHACPDSSAMRWDQGPSAPSQKIKIRGPGFRPALSLIPTTAAPPPNCAVPFRERLRRNSLWISLPQPHLIHPTAPQLRLHPMTAWKPCSHRNRTPPPLLSSHRPFRPPRFSGASITNPPQNLLRHHVMGLTTRIPSNYEHAQTRVHLSSRLTDHDRRRRN